MTFLVNWSFALLFGIPGGRWGTPLGMVFGATYMFGPMLVAILLQKGVYHEPVKGPLRTSLRLNRWFLVLWLHDLKPAKADGSIEDMGIVQS